MPTWKELEKNFAELEPLLKFARLDYQGGAAGEHWRIAASPEQNAERRFELYSSFAGKKLAASKSKTADIVQMSPEKRWYYLLRSSPAYEAGPIAYEIYEDGSRGLITGGAIYNPASVSATQCLEMSLMEPEEENKTAYNVSIHASDNSKVNFGSIDNSVNLSGADVDAFNSVRKSIVEKIPGPDQKALLAEVDNLQKAAHTPSYAEHYKAFIKAVGDHANILGAALATLSFFIK